MLNTPSLTFEDLEGAAAERKVVVTHLRFSLREEREGFREGTAKAKGFLEVKRFGNCFGFRSHLKRSSNSQEIKIKIPIKYPY